MPFHRYAMRDFLARFMNEPDAAPFYKVLEVLPKPRASGPWIAGGAVRRTLVGDALNSDVDYFFTSEAQALAFGEEMVDGLGGWQISQKAHATTYGVRCEHETIIVQAVTMAYYPTLEACLDSFDFTITQFGYDGTDMVCGEHSLWDLARKRLALHKLTFGVSTVRRLIKYTRQGYTACSGVLAAILEQTVANPEVIQREVSYVD